MIDLDDSCPAFLHLLNSDPRRACEMFYFFARGILSVSPPGVMQGIHPDERADLIHDLIVHCVRDNFRVLRTYQDEGKPFSRWFKRVATRKALEQMRQKRRELALHSEIGGGRARSREADDRQHTASEDLCEMIRATNECIALLTLKCQVLLRSAADEYSPREMTLLLGLPAEDSKKVSDDLRHCRKKLAALLADRGFDTTLSDR